MRILIKTSSFQFNSSFRTHRPVHQRHTVSCRLLQNHVRTVGLVQGHWPDQRAQSTSKIRSPEQKSLPTSLPVISMLCIQKMSQLSEDIPPHLLTHLPTHPIFNDLLLGFLLFFMKVLLCGSLKVKLKNLALVQGRGPTA